MQRPNRLATTGSELSSEGDIFTESDRMSRNSSRFHL